MPRASETGLPPASPLSRGLQTKHWVMRPLAFLQGLRELHGDVFTIHLAGVDPWVVVSDPELIRQIFTAPGDVLHAGEGNKVLKSFLGPGAMVLLDGERHMRRRRMLLPRFRGNHVKRYASAMREITEAEIGRWPAGHEEAAWPRMQDITLSVIMRILFGDAAETRLAALRDAIGELLTHSPPPGERGDGRGAAVERANELVAAELARRRRDRASGGDDVLALLLDATYEDGSPLSESDIRDELLMLLVAGHETTATSLAWALERLVRDPEALARTVAEAAGGGGPYTDAVIQETLRLRPALPAFARMVKQPFELGGHSIPPGVTLTPSILLVHHRPDIYPDPGAFRPERFLERPPGTYTWIPFGGGVRRCLGAGLAMFEMRIVLSTLLANASIRAETTRGEAMHNRSITLTPARGARIALDPLRAAASPAHSPLASALVPGADDARRVAEDD